LAIGKHIPIGTTEERVMGIIPSGGFQVEGWMSFAEGRRAMGSEPRTQS
jgi:hypothetical protein